MEQEERRRQLVDALQTLLSSHVGDPVHHAIALAHPTLPQARLSGHVRSAVWIERYAVARNPRAPRELLAILTADTNRVVRAAARSRLAGG